MSRVRDRYDFYRSHGLDAAKDQLRGDLTPELIQALTHLHDILLVSDVMEGPKIRVQFEVPPELDADFQEALQEKLRCP